MFLELVDTLRCTQPHEETWLVASADEMVGRHIRHGVLGCPVCKAQYPVVEFVASFGSHTDHAQSLSLGDDELLRLTALLSLGSPGGVVVISRVWEAFARAIAELDMQVVVLDPSDDAPLGVGISGLRGVTQLPFAPRSLRAVALDSPSLPDDLMLSAARALRPGGRLLAPVGATVPPGVTELARDNRQWVAEASGDVVSPPVKLRRG